MSDIMQTDGVMHSFGSTNRNSYSEQDWTAWEAKNGFILQHVFQSQVVTLQRFLWDKAVFEAEIIPLVKLHCNC